MEAQPVTLIQGLPPPSTATASSRHNPQLIFDFTKRKRWADLLVTELTEAVMLVLSETGVVWYCGPAVKDLLGWEDEDLVDGSLSDIMNENDKETFDLQYKDAIRGRTDLLAYVRLRCKTEHDRYGPTIPVIPTVGSALSADGTPVQPSKPPSKEVLFEIKGYGHYMDNIHPSGSSGYSIQDMHVMSAMGPSSGMVHSNSSFKCFFGMAKPYPSRNTAMLNTFLELKIENERLQQRLRDARAKEAELDRIEGQRASMSSFPLSQQTPYPGNGHTRASTVPQAQSFAWTLNSTPSGPSSFDSRQFYGGHVSGMGGAGSGSPMVAGALGSPGGASGGEHADPSADHTLPRKKAHFAQSKKQFAQELHCCMTCGRTESPEWRKGPQGPKTLCNACGLRWAKSSRNATSAAEADGGASNAQGSAQ